MKRVLQIATTTLQYDGLTEVLLALCSHADTNEFQVDIVLGKGAIPVFLEKLNDEGIRYFQVPDRELDVKHYIPALCKILKAGRYDVVHVHGNSATMALDLFIAMMCGVKRRIAHSHNTRTNHPAVHRLMQPLLNMVTNYPVSCGEDAGKYLFGRKKFHIIPNCINVSDFRFNQRVRDYTRNELKISNKFVVGNVGRFRYQKNHEFIIDIFEEIHNLLPESILLLVGEGRLLDRIKDKVNRLSLQESVIFYGVTDNVAQLLQTMDVFLLPSYYEGLSVTAIEAQTSGLPCIMSTEVSEETRKSENCEFISLDESAKVWAMKICEYNNLIIDRSKGADEIIRAGYDKSTLYKVVENTWGGV